MLAPHPSSWLLRASVFALAVAMFGCDHVTKHAAKQALAEGGSVGLVTGILELRYTENHDTAFSLARTLGLTPIPAVLSAMALVALVALIATWYTTRARLTRMQHVGFALVMAGALGNIVDRSLRGYVVDFIHLTHWPVFNVADMLLVLGVTGIGFGGALRKPRLAG